MGLLDWWKKRRAPAVERFDGQRVVRLSHEAARAVVVHGEAAAAAMESLCPRCGQVMVEALLATRLPGEAASAADAPFVVDGWVCAACGAVSAPRFLSAEESVVWGSRGAEASGANAHGEGEWWFLRIAQAWPDYTAAWLDLTTAVAAWAQLVPEAERAPLRERQWTYLRRAARAAERSPERNSAQVSVEALGRYAQLCTERSEWGEARRVVEVIRGFAMTGEQRERFEGFTAWLGREPEVFAAAAAVVSPHLVLSDDRRQPVPEARRHVVSEAVRVLVSHHERYGEWNALWLAAKGQQALGEGAAALSLFRQAEAAHGDEVAVVVEASLACLHAGEHDEARQMNRRGVARHPDEAALWSNLAICELLCGDFAAAREATGRSDGDARTAALARVIEGWARKGRPPASFDELNKTTFSE